MPWFRQPPQLILSRIVGLSTTLWFCCKVGSLAKNLSRLAGSLLFRLLRPARLWRYPDYGHLLMVPLYPGNPPSLEATSRAKELLDEAKASQVSKSMDLLGEAILLNPPGVEVYLLRAKQSNSHGMPIAALDDAEMCVSIDSKCVEGWLEKGKAELALGRAMDAAQSFTQGLQLAPDHQELKEKLAAARAEPSPNIVQQVKDFLVATGLGLESLFRTLEDPQKTTDAFVESNVVKLDTQLELLAQTLHVNTSVLFESPRLCDAYDQIVRACSQLVAGAPGAFSRHLQQAESITKGLCLAVRIGWHIHHGIAKHAATALIMLALCPTAGDALRRMAVRQLLGGFLRWLLDARPEPEREGEEICGCNCSVPWKAAACFLERLLEPRALLVQQECEAWPDTVQLCQWLTLSVRDYHATPLGLVALLQMPKVAAKAMKSQAQVDFFIAPHIFGDDFGDPLDESGDEKEEEFDSPEDTMEAASQSDVPWWRAAQMSRQPLRAWRQQLRFMAAAAEASARMPPQPEVTPQVPLSSLGELDALRWLPDPPPPPAQRLGEWLMNSLGYLFLFIEGDALFTVYACQALQTLARADAEEDGRTRLLHGVWLGLPLLSKLSLAACTNTAALDLLHCLLEADDPAARQGVRAAVRSLAQALAYETKDPASASTEEVPAEQGPLRAPPVFEMNPTEGLLPEMEGIPNNLLMAHEDDLVPSWAEFHHELFQELACPSIDGSAPDLVTLANFETKANLLAELATVHALDPSARSSDAARCTCTAIPAAWNRNREEMPPVPQKDAPEDQDSPWQTVSTSRWPIFFEENALVGADEYISDQRKRGKVVLMSRRSIRSSSKVHNWAQAVSAAEAAGASAVVVFNDLDVQEPFRMGLFGEKLPNIPAFMVSGKDGSALCAAKDCDLRIVRSVLTSMESTPPWPLAGGRIIDLAQAWSLLEALSAHEPEELDELLQRMSVPEKRVWLTRRLVRHHRTAQATGPAELPLAFVEGDRWLPPQKQLEALRKQYCEGTGIGSPDICGEFEVRFRGEQGVGSAVVREWMDLVAREVYLHPKLRLLRSYDQRQTFWPDVASTFCNNCWKMDYEILGCLIGLALWQNCTLDLPLHPHVCALLFGFPSESVTTTLADLDPELYRHKVQWLLANPINDLGIDLSFSDPLGIDESQDEDEEVESLPPLLSRSQRLPGDSSATVLMRVNTSEVLLSEAETTVTDENKHGFVHQLERWKLHEGIAWQVEAIAKGLGKVLPGDLRQEMHSLLTPTEIAQLLSGLGTLNVEDWEAHTAYTHGLHKDSHVVRYFWQVVHDWADTEEALLPQLLQFVTGSARVPVGGFNELVGFNGAKHAFTLAGASHLSKDALPVAHTCICTLDMPNYPDLETCRHKMTQMLRLGRSHFDEGAGAAET